MAAIKKIENIYQGGCVSDDDAGWEDDERVMDVSDCQTIESNPQKVENLDEILPETESKQPALSCSKFRLTNFHNIHRPCRSIVARQRGFKQCISF